MDHEPESPRPPRENMLAVSLVAMVGGGFLFYLYLITLGIVGNLVGIGAVIIAVGCLHYFVWGRGLSREVAAEREAMLRKEAREEAARAKLHATAIQDLTRQQGIRER